MLGSMFFDWLHLYEVLYVYSSPSDISSGIFQLGLLTCGVDNPMYLQQGAEAHGGAAASHISQAPGPRLSSTASHNLGYTPAYSSCQIVNPMTATCFSGLWKKWEGKGERRCYHTSPSCHLFWGLPWCGENLENLWLKNCLPASLIVFRAICPVVFQKLK